MRAMLAGVLALASIGSARADATVVYDRPDTQLRVAGAVSGSMVNLTRSAFNWGLVGHVNFSPVPAVELQGVGLLNLPGSGLQHAYLEGGLFVGFAWRGEAKIRTGGYTDGNYIYTNYAHAEGGARRKFGLDIGGFLDRHTVHYWAENDKRRVQSAPRVPIGALGLYGGIKWVYQTNLLLANGAGEWMRFVFFAHALYAVKQSVEVPPNDTVGPSYSPGGGRLGVELSSGFGMGPFFRFEFAAIPSMNGPDVMMVMMLGLSAADSLEWTFATRRRVTQQ